MRCVLVFYSVVVTLFVVVCSSRELCVFEDYYGETRANCGRDDVEYRFDFIPPVYQNITCITMRGQPLKQLPYNAFRNVSSQRSISLIWLEDCQISQVDAGALLNLHKLIAIHLSYNKIKQIDSELFSHTKQIKYVFMRYNMIEVVPNGLFQNLTQLTEVDLRHNRIHRVERFSFKNTPSLWEIYLDNNRIECMSMLFKDEFHNLTYLALYDNPWKCDCELGPLYEFLVKTNQLHDQELVCEKPPTLHGRDWSDISRDIFVCSSEDAPSTQDSVMTSIKAKNATEQDDTVPVTVYNGTRNQPGDTGTPQPPPNQSWMPYTISVLVLVCLVPVITGVVLLKRRSDRRTNARNMNSNLSMLGVQSSPGSENNDSATNMADVEEQPASIHHNGLRAATTS